MTRISKHIEVSDSRDIHDFPPYVGISPEEVKRMPAYPFMGDNPLLEEPEKDIYAGVIIDRKYLDPSQNPLLVPGPAVNVPTTSNEGVSLPERTGDSITLKDGVMLQKHGDTFTLFANGEAFYNVDTGLLEGRPLDEALVAMAVKSKQGEQDMINK